MDVDNEFKQLPGMIVLEAIPGKPMVTFEEILPLLSAGARLEIELRATQLAATRLAERNSELQELVADLRRASGEVPNS